MKTELKRLKAELNRYFGGTPHCILFTRCRNRLLVDIEYTDFLNEPHVKEAVRRIIGPEPLLNVKRECSPELMERIKESFGNGTYTIDELFDRMETFEDGEEA